MSDHDRGCQGREYTCTCGYDAAKDAEIAKLRNALYECEEYFDNRADADHDEAGFVPNEEMKLLHAVRDALLGGEDVSR